MKIIQKIRELFLTDEERQYNACKYVIDNYQLMPRDGKQYVEDFARKCNVVCDFSKCDIVFAALSIAYYGYDGVFVDKCFIYKTKNGNYVRDNGFKCKRIEKGDVWDEVRHLRVKANRVLVDKYAEDFSDIEEI